MFPFLLLPQPLHPFPFSAPNHHDPLSSLPNLLLRASKAMDLQQGVIDPASKVADPAKITQINDLLTQPQVPLPIAPRSLFSFLFIYYVCCCCCCFYVGSIVVVVFVWFRLPSPIHFCCFPLKVIWEIERIKNIFLKMV